MKEKILAVLIGIIGVLFSVKNVYALENDSTLKTEYLDKVYAYHYKDGVLRSYGRLPYRYQNNLLAYCIEPNRVINQYTYNSTTDWSITGYSEDDKKKMQLIAYYGYGYDNHNTDKYYMATQELIWLFSDDKVIWMDDYSTDASVGNKIDIEKEKNEILRLVNNYNILPSFNGNCYNRVLGENLSLNDSNNVLNTFEVTSNMPFTISDNNIFIESNKFGNYEFDLTKKITNNKDTIIYYVENDSQMMATFGIDEEINAKFNVVIDKVKIRINKRDLNTKQLIKNNTGKFRINASNGSSNIDGYVLLDLDGYAYYEVLRGTYKITEINAPIGYLRNKEKISFTIDDNISLNDGYFDIDIYNDVPKGEIEIVKEGENGEELYGVEFGLYDSNHNLVSTLTTKEDGNIFSNLMLGKYYLKERKTLSGYILDTEEHEINLEYVNDRTSIVKQTIKLYNKKIKCDIVYITLSDELKLSDVEINVYNENGEIVFTGKTNKDGQVIISDLPYGKYYIKQIKVPSGYILNEEEYVFYVNDSTCQSKIEVQNEKTIMPITSTSINKCMCIAFLLSSLGIKLFVKKSN